MGNSHEIWKDIPDYEGIYQISSIGRIKSLPRFIPCRKGERLTKEKILKPYIGKSGYYRIGLHKNNSFKLVLVHRVYCQLFLPNPENKSCINHKNGVKHDNRIENLEWCTISENTKHAFEVLGRKVSGAAVGGKKWPPHKKGENHHRYGKPNINLRRGASHPNAKKIKCPTLEMCFDSVKEASDKLGICQSLISCVLLGNSTHTSGLYFRYLN